MTKGGMDSYIDDGLLKEENTMAKTSAKRLDRRPATRNKAAQPKDLPEAACIVCGSEAWCDCEWDHFYGETVEAQAQEAI